MIDTFFMAENIGEKDKDLLLNKLKVSLDSKFL